MYEKTQIGFSIDAIIPSTEDYYYLRLIPDYKSKYFIPAHTRYMRTSENLLEKQYLSWINEHQYIINDPINIETAIGSVVQGKYYIITREDFRSLTSGKNEFVLGKDYNDVLHDAERPSPCNDSPDNFNKIVQDTKWIENLNDDTVSNKHKDNTFLYCFYVGQGDMLLLITSSKNAYIIDINIHSDDHRDAKINKIKSILKAHNMDEHKIKGLIITHKHLDHFRGAAHLIDSNAFNFDNLIMNFDYKHSNIVVNGFLDSAKKIPTWINLNSPCQIIEGGTYICFRNPTDMTRRAPDINDSSIVICVRHKDSSIYLTGDASVSILEKSLRCDKRTLRMVGF